MSETAVEAVKFLSPLEVEGRADEVRRRHNLTTVPINPLTLAHREGIEVNNAWFENGTVAGMILRRGVDVSILVNQDDPPFRKRFTIAHELGHHFLHLTRDGEYVDKETNLFRQQPGDDRATTPDRRKEIQANLFAAALLMPAGEVRRYWMERQSIEELARIFQVSASAMGYRVELRGPITGDEVDQYGRLQGIRERAKHHRTIINAWKQQQDQDRKLRRLYANWLMIVMSAQVVAINVLFFLVGRKALAFDRWTINIFVTAVFAEVGALVLLVVKYLFPATTDRILDLIDRFREKDRGE